MDWLITTIIVGAIVGALGRLIVPGKQRISVIATILLGIAGAVVGGWLYTKLGGSETEGIDWIQLAVSAGVAALLIWLYVRLSGGRRR